MPGSITSAAAAVTRSSSMLRPAARGSLACFCRGEVIEMRGQYGWLKVYGGVDHPLASKRGGHVYIHKQDVVLGGDLVAGDIVTFYLYVDSQGLGAEHCQVDASSSKVAQDTWQGSYTWGNNQIWPQSQVLPQLQEKAVCYAPYGYTVVESPTTPSPTAPYGFTVMDSPTTPSPTAPFTTHSSPTSNESLPEDVDSDEELPSVGSAGHHDGSCKRCAFFPKGRCQNGKDCTHCHYDHSSRMRLRKRRPHRTYAKDNGSQETAFSCVFQEDETCSTPDSLPKDVEVLSSSDNDKVADPKDVEVLSSSDNEKVADPLVRRPSKDEGLQGADIPSEDDVVDTTTRAPSSAVSEDESMPAHNAASGKALDGRTDFGMKQSPSEGSDSESGISRGCATSTDAPRSDVEQSDASPMTPFMSPKLSPKSRDLQFSPAKLSPTSHDLPLSPTSWAAQLRARRAGGNKEVSTAEIARMARSLLNKLTHERFESLCGQILALPFSTPEQLAVLAAEIFEKATTQDGFRSLYTELCVRLDAHLVDQPTAVGGKAFRKALVNECQATFERHLQPADPALFAGLTEEECFEVEMKLKTRRLGNMRFIGELLNARLLAHKLMPPIVLELLNGDEASLESLIALLTVIAPVFEKDTCTSLYKGPLRDAFATLRRKKTEAGLSARLRCHLSDLFDARARDWAPRTA